MASLVRLIQTQLGRIISERVWTVYIAYRIVHRLIIWPYFVSPLRKVPGPGGNLILGQSRVIISSESGIPQREWVKKYGPIVRIVGPVGVERLVFMEPEALQQILVKDWLQYPRVGCSQPLNHENFEADDPIQPAFLRNILGLVAGYGLLTVTGDEHRQMRRVMNPAFSIPNLMARECHLDACFFPLIRQQRLICTGNPLMGKHVFSYAVQTLLMTSLDLLIFLRRKLFRTHPRERSFKFMIGVCTYPSTNRCDTYLNSISSEQSNTRHYL